VKVPSVILSTSISFFVLFAIFRPLEKCFPAKEGQRLLRPEWFTDLAFFLGQYLLWTGLVFAATVGLAMGLSRSFSHHLAHLE
jgi:hypothetical protein